MPTASRLPGRLRLKKTKVVKVKESNLALGPSSRAGATRNTSKTRANEESPDVPSSLLTSCSWADSVDFSALHTFDAAWYQTNRGLSLAGALG